MMTNTDIKTETETKNSLQSTSTIETDVLIIGSGLAGLSVALSLPKRLQVTIISKDKPNKCSSYYAQGGIAGMLAADDSVSNHVKDTLIAGDGLCHPANTGQILQQGVGAIDWLCQQDVPFTTEQITTEQMDKTAESLHLTREGGHSHRRIVHADDATGKHIMDTLLAQVQACPNIELLANHEALELIQGEVTPSGKNTIKGARIINNQTHQHKQLITITAKAVVLASGGLGQLFKRATAPSVCIGDGVMMAWQAGCRLANLEFVQFHPTGLAVAGQDEQARNFLISEAVRGEGGLLFCPVSGKRFMLDVDERAELAPRDIVARAIYKQGKLNGLGYVHLDISHRLPEFVKAHFPQIYAYCLNKGIDITCEPIPVAPTAHYSCGGVLTTAEGLTDVVGLYAVGEVAYTGLHGANRLASNSLLECVVVGRQIAKHLTQNIHQAIHQELDSSWQFPQPQIEENNILTVVTDNCHVKKAQLNAMGQNLPMTVRAARQDKAKNINKESHANQETDKNHSDKIGKLKQLMNDNMGIERNQYALQMAYQQLEQWQFEETVLHAQLVQKQQEAENQGVYELDELRWQRLLTLAQLMINSALTRQESRGGHYRSDYLNKRWQAKVSVVG